MNLKALAALFLCLCAPLALAATLSEAEFTAEFVRQAQAAQPDTRFTVVAPLHVTAKPQSGMESAFFLDNGYAQYKAQPGRLQQILADRLGSSQSSGNAAAPQPNSAILAVVKPFDYIDNVTKQQQKAGAARDMKLSLIYENLNEDMF